MKKTVLYETHVKLGARMAPFGGYLMPIQYEGIVKEHTAARTATAIFDTCHMGEFEIRGSGAPAFLERMLSCKVNSIRPGQCRYGFLCNESGGVIDDQILYRTGDDRFFMVVNASTEQGDFQWLQNHCPEGVELTNISGVTAKIDIQGPGSPKIASRLFSLPVNNLTYYTFMSNRYRGTEVLLSRTGYTGEIGFEVYCPNELAAAVWDDCLNNGAVPAGLGARDTLRLEMGFPLYGHELDSSINAAESGFDRAIARDKDFIGSAAVLDPLAMRKKLSGVELEGRRAARSGDKVYDPDGKEIGRVTSGSFGPSVGKAVALASIDRALSQPGHRVIVSSGKADIPGAVASLPFYHNATGRDPMEKYV